jgi:hypothetical protein
MHTRNLNFSKMFTKSLWEKFLSHFPIDHSEPPGGGESVIRYPGYPYPNSDSDTIAGPCPEGPELIRVNTVSPLYRRSTSPFRQHKNTYVPFLRLSGLWLERFGFEIGDKFEIYAMKNQLILRTSSYGSSCICELDKSIHNSQS